ncbi:hypothetical protein ERJ75_001623200 [Trypanosoma vivax]|uniref:Uncharacterized protein n=1 Tax=Trypanosoma vivax (strain Y486) TaxID=1055687 RepID=G0TT81_TRYVY|nr:hypothetical protein TRVL_03233 [Trypanosoma vivax]KAH8605352.1 hypothetical protein ERJ75_001623200 [Trypanosoma vivax]CCC47162.1 conserved hypothetical protein [Trypanosoma vivax Y486]
MSDVIAVAAGSNGNLLLLGCESGLRVYRLDTSGNPKKLIPATGGAAAQCGCTAAGGPVSVITALGETPLIAFVLGGSAVRESAGALRVNSDTGVTDASKQLTSELYSACTSRVLFLYDACTFQNIAELHFDTAVVGVRLNSEVLAVVLEVCVHVFDLRTLKQLAKLRTLSPRNPNGLLVISDPTTNVRGEAVSYLAYPQSDDGSGDVWVAQVYGAQMNHSHKDATDTSLPPAFEAHANSNNKGLVESAAIVRAHLSAVVCLAMTRDGTRLATASQRGTTVKVFQVPSARLLFVFRRGVAKARMHALAFEVGPRSKGLRLAAVSSRGTLHLFRCGDDSETKDIHRGLHWPSSSLGLGMEVRSFAQATVGRKNSLSGGDCGRRHAELSCFFSDDNRYVWVVAPPCYSAECNTLDTPREEWHWSLQQYSIHRHGCTFVRSHLLT